MLIVLSRQARACFIYGAAAIVAVGCASGGSVPPGGGTVRALPSGGSGAARAGSGLEVTARNDGQTIAYAAEPGAVFDALTASYAALQIPLTRQEPGARILGNEGLKMRRQLGKIELRRAFDCGGTPGMPNSETYEITASIVSALSVNETKGTLVTTVIEATGQNPSFTGSSVRCSSTGTLEAALDKDLRTRLNQRQD